MGTCASASVANQSVTKVDKRRLSECRDGIRECLHRLLVRVPAGHEADLARTPVVKLETLVSQRSGFLLRGLDENLVRLDRMKQPLGRGSPKGLSGGIGRARVVEPQVVLDHRKNLGCKHSAFGGKMPSALAPDLDFVGEFGAKENQALGVEATILDETEGQRVHPSPPANVGEPLARGCDRVGQPSAVHVQGKTTPSSDIS